MYSTSADFFVTGPLPADSSYYMERPADKALLDYVQSGYYCYVLAPAQFGKTNLMNRVARLLQQQHIQVATVQLGQISATASQDDWYLELVQQLKIELNLAVGVDNWWSHHASLKPTQRIVQFLQNVVLTQLDRKVVVFIDQLEALLNLKFGAEFLATLYAIHNNRAGEPIWQRLTVVLLGVGYPSDFVKDTKQSLFAVARQIELAEFSPKDMRVLLPGLEAVVPGQAKAILARIFYWTSGHPFLTQKLCQVLEDTASWGIVGGNSSDLVDRLVDRLFIAEAEEQEPAIIALEQRIANHPYRKQGLVLYQQIYEGKQVSVNEQASDQRCLSSLGLVRAEEGALKIHNRIFRQKFNLHWLKANTTSTWPQYVMIGGIILAVVLIGVFIFAIYNQVGQLVEAQAKPFIENLNRDTDVNTQLTSLAQLFNLADYQEQAREAFFQKLSLEERIALFQPADPRAVGVEMVTVIKGVYTAPTLENNEQDNRLLLAMAESMRGLVIASIPDTVNLDLEIIQWLKGRAEFNDGLYQEAIDSYRVAIEVNDNNPGTHFDRGVAFTAASEPERALEDFDQVLKLDPKWQPRVQQALQENESLYNTLWINQDLYQDLVALVPTPTPTAVPTDTPMPTATPSPTSTPTRPAVTATPTPTLTPTPPPAIAATPTPIPGANTSIPVPAGPPTGSFTLLAPLSIDNPTYGPTIFEWSWSGSVPAEFGFEVRVWKEGALPTGVHNAVLDNKNGAIKNLGNNKYQLSVDIKEAAGVSGQSGDYLWSVALVRVSPKYRDLGLQAPPAKLRFAAPGSSGGGGKDSGSGGVGIE
jgi:tetratricopeptide (TPR) repeat protein